MGRRRWLLAAAGIAACGARAHGLAPPAPDRQALQPLAAAPGTRDARTYFTDLQLQTHDGRSVRFYSDLLEGRTVLINVIYTHCTDACPLITQQLDAVRRQLPEGTFGSRVQFVTLSSDPVRDTPAALEAFARRQGVDVKGWSFVTGRREHIETILKRLGQFSQHLESHSTLLLAGNVPARRWSKIRPEAPAAAIAQRLLLLAGDSEPGTPR